MNLKEFINKLLSKLKSNKAQSGGQPPSARSQEVIKNMLRKIEQTQEIELTCGETFDLLDQYAEMVMNGEDVTQLMPLVKLHLDMCPDCRDEFEALLTVLQNTTAL